MTDTRAEFEGLFWGLLAPITIAVFFTIVLLLTYALVRGRRRPLASARSEAPRRELAYVAALAAVIAVVLGFSFRAESRVDEVAEEPRLRIDVTAFQWQWRFAYPGTDVSLVGSPGRRARLVIPTDTTVRFALEARDVIHAFWIPALRFKRDAFPDHEEEFDLVFREPGTFVGRCAEFCGLHHADMTFDIVAVRPSEFEAWLAEEQARR
jgi:cytochrome c oxidase subunit 2